MKARLTLVSHVDIRRDCERRTSEKRNPRQCPDLILCILSRFVLSRIEGTHNWRLSVSDASSPTGNIAFGLNKGWCIVGRGLNHNYGTFCIDLNHFVLHDVSESFQVY